MRPVQDSGLTQGKTRTPLTALARIFHQVAPVDREFSSETGAVSTPDAESTLVRRGYAGLRCADGRGLALNSSRVPTGTRLRPSRAIRIPPAHRNSRVPDEISRLARRRFAGRCARRAHTFGEHRIVADLIGQ